MNVGLKALTAVIVLAVVLVASPIPGWAQAGWYVTPSVRLIEEFDDNIFGKSSGRESDFITRAGLGVKAGFQSTPLTLLGSYSFDSEVFVEHPDLSGPATRKLAGLELQYLPIRPVAIGLTASFAETQAPTEFNTETEIEVGRREATILSVSPTASYRLTPLTTSDAAYIYRSSSVSGGATNETHQAQLNLTRELTPLDAGTLGYRLSVFQTDGSATRTSHALVAGWNRRLTERTSLGLLAGPRISDGSIGPEVAAHLEHQLKLAKLALAYVRTESIVIGRAGPVNTEGLSGSVAFEPLRSLNVDLAPAVKRAWTGGGRNSLDATVYSLTASLSYRITEWLTARAVYRFSHQEQRQGEIQRDRFSIGLEMSYPTRVH